MKKVLIVLLSMWIIWINIDVDTLQKKVKKLEDNSTGKNQDIEQEAKDMFEVIKDKSGTNCTYLPGWVYLKPEWKEEFKGVCEGMGGKVEIDKYDSSQHRCICPQYENTATPDPDTMNCGLPYTTATGEKGIHQCK